MNTKLDKVPIVQLPCIRFVTALELYGIAGTQELRTETVQLRLTLGKEIAALKRVDSEQERKNCK